MIKMRRIHFTPSQTLKRNGIRKSVYFKNLHITDEQRYYSYASGDAQRVVIIIQ